MTTPTPVKFAATKFWVSLVGALLLAASLVGLPGWWGKGVAIAVAALSSVGVYQFKNKPVPPPYTVTPFMKGTEDGT